LGEPGASNMPVKVGPEAFFFRIEFGTSLVFVESGRSVIRKNPLLASRQTHVPT